MKYFSIILLLMCGQIISTDVFGQPRPGSSLKKTIYGFENIQDSTKTKTWWFHGYVPSSIEGMTKDLEAFKRVGLGGVVFYDQVHGTVSPKSELAMSPEWWKLVYHVARETQRLGLNFEFNVSNGFVAGGPWIKPQNAMKRVECIESTIQGGRTLTMKLDAPKNSSHYFKDIRIVAIPTHDGVGDEANITYTNLPDMDSGAFFQKGRLVTVSPLSSPSYINFDFRKQKELRNISYEIGPTGKSTTSATNIPAPPQDTFVGTGYRILPPVGELQCSDNGMDYRKVCDLKPLYLAHESYKKKTLSFAAVKARYFRIKLSGWDGSVQGKTLKIGNISLSSDAKVNEYEYKAAYISEYIEKSMNSPKFSSLENIQLNEERDITDCLSSDGTLRWKAPKGNWKILRFCMVPTGGVIKHGRPNMMGLECDKMSAVASKLQFDSYFAVILDSLQSHGLNNLQGMIMDSHEAGSQNWTDDFPAEFKKRRGYDLFPYLPVMAGYVVKDIRHSEAFLYDVRLTIADLIAERYYGCMDSLCRQRGITFTAQATGNAQCIVAIPIVAKGKVQKPQGEFWAMQPDGNYDIKEASSAAHLYGKNIASAEAFTDARLEDNPSNLKTNADAAYAFGINEFVICASAHQPDDIAPGNNGGRVYNTFCRNNPWWNTSENFWNYQSRMAYVMRQGRPVADLCVYLGNNAPVRILTHRLPEIPSGYDFDAFTEDALLTRMNISDGRILLPSGQSYSMMVLPRSGEISYDALCKIASIVKGGGMVYGNRPTGSPCMKDIGKDKEYRQLVDDLWNHPNAWKGKVFSSMTLTEALHKAGVAPDIQGSRLLFAHRETDDCDIYFLNNHTDRRVNGTFVFKTQRKNAQLWDPMTGQRSSIESDKGIVRLDLEARQAVVVVFTDER